MLGGGMMIDDDDFNKELEKMKIPEKTNRPSQVANRILMPTNEAFGRGRFEDQTSANQLPVEMRLIKPIKKSISPHEEKEKGKYNFSNGNSVLSRIKKSFN
jgi:hypothetical protein